MKNHERKPRMCQWTLLKVMFVNLFSAVEIFIGLVPDPHLSTEAEQLNTPNQIVQKVFCEIETIVSLVALELENRENTILLRAAPNRSQVSLGR